MLVALLLAPAGADAAVSRPIGLRAEDGTPVAATLYEAPKQPAPAVILLHMQTRSREDWRAFGHRLADSGIHALALDFRGHGGSGAGPVGEEGQVDPSRLALDVRAARTYLAGRPEAFRGSAVGLLGASVGANVAILFAAGDPSIRSLALLSPGLDYRSLRTEAALRKYGPRPALLVAGADDPYALRSARELAKAAEGIREVRTPGPVGHGSVMLSRDPDLERVLVDWFQRTLL